MGCSFAVGFCAPLSIQKPTVFEPFFPMAYASAISTPDLEDDIAQGVNRYAFEAKESLLSDFLVTPVNSVEPLGLQPAKYTKYVACWVS